MASQLGLKRLLVANRGEIACRAMRSAQRLGLETVAIFSEADVGAKHVRAADIAVPVGHGSAAATSYLDADAVLGAMRATGADCVHPGYGFLSENAAFARSVADAGFAFVGPPASAIDDMGDKLRSKEIATDAGVSVIPGGAGAVADVGDALAIAESIGYPVMLKASAGGGGKGMRVAHNDGEVRELYAVARDEAARSFGDDRLLVEKFVTARRPSGIETGPALRRPSRRQRCRNDRRRASSRRVWSRSPPRRRLRGLSASRPRRRRVAVSTGYPRRGRGVAATRLRRISSSRPRRRRDASPQNAFVSPKVGRAHRRRATSKYN